MWRGFISVSASLCLAACTSYSPSEVANPNGISVKDAFDGVAAGLISFANDLDTAQIGHPQNAGEIQTGALKLGMITCRIAVNFNISAQVNQNRQAKLAITVPVQAASIGASGSLADTAAAARGNVVTVELDSIYPEICARYAAAGVVHGSAQATSAV